jgi:GT2 family glycosyltransferase
MSSPRVAVAVPTRDRPGALAQCLAALEAQTIARELEILVVCDGTDAAPRIAEVVRGSRRARLLVQDQAGPGSARNLAARAASAPILLCTDDDCEPRPDWAERLAAAIEHGADGAVGRTLNGAPQSAIAAASQLVVTHLQEQTLCDGGVYGAANNLGCRTEALRRLPFDPAFRFAGGDRDWCARAAAAGLELVYEPEACVVHRQRLTLMSFWRQQLAYGRGAYLFRRRCGAPVRLENVGFYAGLVRRAVADRPAVGGLVVLGQAATAAGFLLEALDGRR